jgi:hypothetical protein
MHNLIHKLSMFSCCSSFAHEACMVKFIRLSGFFEENLKTCTQILTGRMFDYLNAYFIDDVKM